MSEGRWLYQRQRRKARGLRARPPSTLTAAAQARIFVPSTAVEGFVYFVQCNGSRGPIKIGHAGDTGARLSTLQIGCPYRLKLLVEYWAKDRVADELRLHTHFAATRFRGEWFTCTPELMNLIALIQQTNQDQFIEAMTGPRP